MAKGASGRSSARPPCPQMPKGHPGVAKGDFWTVFGTTILPTGTSEPSRRAKEVSKRKKAVISKQGEEVISEQREAVISEQREEMASVQGEAVISKQGEAVISEQRGEEVLPGGDDCFGGKTAR